MQKKLIEKTSKTGAQVHVRVVKYRNPNTNYAKTQGKQKQTHQCTCTDLKRHLLNTQPK
jgi:hypothetical protein